MYAFSFEKSKKLDKKACFCAKEADWNFQNCYKNHFFFQPKSQARILNSGVIFKQKMWENVRIQLRKD